MAGAIGVPHAALTSGTSARAVVLENYVFASGIHEPEISNILSYKFPQYYLTALLDRIQGGSSNIAQSTWSWFEMDRTRKWGTISALSIGNGTTTTTVEVAEFVYAAASGAAGINQGYAIVGDVFRCSTGATVRVTAVTLGSSSATAQKLTISPVDGVTLTNASVVGTGVGDGNTLGHVYNAQVENSDAPTSRVYLPVEKFNFTTIMRRTFKVSGSEATNRTYIGNGGAWYFEQENIEMKEFARDKEGLVMFGEAYSDGTTAGTVKSGKGLWQHALDDGISTTFAAATGITETDIQDTLKDLMVQGGSANVIGLCGSQIHLDAQRALKDYSMSGAINYGGFGGNEVGIDVSSYRIGGRTLDLVYYALFDDVAMVPHSGSTATAAETDFANAMLILDMGSDDKGHKLLSLKYKELNGSSRKFIHAYETGMMSPDGNNGGKVSGGGDNFSVHYLCEVGLEARLTNRLAIIRATS
jgi:hypothetical protein